MKFLNWEKINRLAITFVMAFFVASTGFMLTGMDVVSTAQAASDQGKSGQSGGHSGGGKGRKGAGIYQRGSANKSLDAFLDEVADDSDRPDWAGPGATEPKPGGGSKGGDTRRGDLFGDLWAILRDDNGVPILVKWVDGVQVVYPGSGSTAGWFVQPLDADGNPVPLDEEGHPVDGNLPVEVDLGRLNVARAPEKVLDHSLVEALSKLTTADEVTLDPSGRLVADGVTIDSPLENLALFKAIVSTPAVDGMITLTASAMTDGQDVTYSFEISVEQAGLVAAAAIAAASDKTGTLSSDEVMYIADFFGLSSELSTFVSTWNYERDDVYTDDVTVWILEGVDTDGDGEFDVYYPVEVQINEAVEFNTIPAIVADGNGIDTFTQAADDSVQVLEFVHDNAIDQ